MFSKKKKFSLRIFLSIVLVCFFALIFLINIKHVFAAASEQIARLQGIHIDAIAGSNFAPQYWYGTSSIFDPIKNKIYYFGGMVGDKLLQPCTGTTVNPAYIRVLSLDPTSSTFNQELNYSTLYPPSDASMYRAAVYDPDTKKTYLFGGTRLTTSDGTCVGGAYKVDKRIDLPVISQYDSAANTLTNISGVDASAFTSRTKTATVYNSTNKKIYIFGGENSADIQNRASQTTFYNDLFEYDPINNTFKKITFNGTFSARSGASAAYDPATQKAYIFGGLNSAGALGDILSYDFLNNTFYTVSSNAFSPRQRTGAVYNTINHNIDILGGTSGIAINGVPNINEVLEFNTSNFSINTLTDIATDTNSNTIGLIAPVTYNPLDQKLYFLGTPTSLQIYFYRYSPPPSAIVPTLSVTLSATSPIITNSTSNMSATVGGTATGTINYSFWWNCTNASNSVSAVKAACGDPANSSIGFKKNDTNTNPMPTSHVYSSAGTYTVKVIAERDTAVPATTSVSVVVKQATLTGTLVATSPVSAGSESHFTATAGGTAVDTLNYTFWWNCASPGTDYASTVSACGDPVGNSSIGDKTHDGINDNPLSITHIYPSIGTYYPTVVIQRDGAPAVVAYDSVDVTAPTYTLSGNLSATPSAGYMPLSTILTAVRDNTSAAIGTISYSFWWDCPDTKITSGLKDDVDNVESFCGALVDNTVNDFGYKSDNQIDNHTATISASKTTNPPHVYITAGTYTARIIIEQGSLSDTKTVPITIAPTGTPSSVKVDVHIDWLERNKSESVDYQSILENLK